MTRTITGSELAAVADVRRATVWAVALAFVFWVLFQLSKLEVIQAANPFANDPYDAVGSMAMEAAVAVAVLGLARLLRLAKSPKPSRTKLRLIVRGNNVVLAAVAAAAITDVIAVLQNPAPLRATAWGLVPSSASSPLPP